jgi:multidrug efflux pump subunit AcrB
MKTYLRMATWCMKHRLSTMVMAMLFFFGSIALIPLLPTGFIPPDDNSQTQVYLELPPGSTLAQTLARRAGARADHQSGTRAQRIHHDWRRQRPVAIRLPERRRRSAQGHADHAAGRAHRAPRKQGIENEDAQRWSRARRAQQGRPGRLGREIHAGAHRRRPATRCRPPRAVEKDLRTIPGLGSVAPPPA